MRWFLGILFVVGLVLYFAFSESVEVVPEKPAETAPAQAEPAVEPALPEVLPPGNGPCAVEGTVLRDNLAVPAVVAAYKHRDGFGRLLPAADNHQEWLSRPVDPPRLLARVKAGADGRFSIPGLPVGRVLLVARAADGARGHRPLNIVRGATKSTVLSITGGSERIEGRARWSDGRPFRGIVWAVPKIKKYTNTRSGRVNAVAVGADGSFELTGLPKGIAFLSFFAPSEIEMTKFKVPIPSAGLDVVIDEGFVEFRGRVLAAGTDEPIAGARVNLGTSSATSATVAVETDAEGRFVIRAPGARGGISVTAPGFTSWLEIWPKVGEEIEVRLLRPGRVKGRVTAVADGSPVGGVAVRLERVNATTMNWWVASVTADADGRLVCDSVAPGTVRAHVLDRGWASEGLLKMTRYGFDPLRVEIIAGGSAEVEVPVVPAGRAQVKLRSADGSSLAGKSVRARLPGDWRGFRHETGGRTGEDGAVVIENLVPGFPYRFSAKPREELLVESGPHRVRSGELLEVELRHPPCRWLRVRVTWEEDGSPVAGVYVYGYRKAVPYQTVGWGRTDAEGNARVGPLPMEELTVQVSSKDAQYREAVFVPGSDRPSDLEPMGIRVSKGYEISGRLVWADGTPRYSEQVVASSPGLKEPRFCQVDYDGTFGFACLPPGSYRLSVHGKQDVEPIPAEAGTTDIVYKTGEKPGTKKRQSLVLRIVGPKGRPVRTGKVWLHPPTGQSWPILGGRASTSYLDPDDKAITFEVVDVVGAEGRPLGSVLAGPFDPADGEATVRLDAGRSIEGVVLSPDGTPAHGVIVEALPAVGERRYRAHAKAHTGPDGRFLLSKLGEKEYRIALREPEGCAPVPKRKVATGRSDVVVRLRAGKDVTLTILDAVGKPMLGVVVYARQGELEWRDNTDERGVARLLGVPEGESVRLDVAPPRGRTDVVSTRRKEWWPADETIRLGRAFVVSGVVRDAAGNPVKYARVYYATEERWLGGSAVVADTEGAFRLRRLRKRDVWLVAISPGSSLPKDFRNEAVQIMADAEDVVLTVVDR